jgi:xanthine dehydrogenase YagT iron-sulfur-binding subunit
MSDYPRVLAFLHEWHPERADAADIAVIRAELRGLGAELVVITPAGTWSFRPDDLVEPCEAHLVVDPEVEGEAVFVLDEKGRVRFEHRAPRLENGLASALTAAGHAMYEPGLLLTRREWNLTALVTGFAFVFLRGCKTRDPDPVPAPSAPVVDDVAITLDINGKVRELRVDPRASLLDTLRERLELTGTKKGCDMGQCGACTVLLDGERVLACLTLAVMAQGKKITTIEGLATGDELHPMQKAFIEHDGLQCGYCTPGQILSAVALVAEGNAKTDDEIRRGMCGNLCRCGAQPNIVAAIQSVRKGA